MLLNIIKILTVLSYCFIPIYGAHFGAPLIFYMYIGVSNGFVMAFVILAALVILLLTIWRKIIISEKILIPAILIFLVGTIYVDGGFLKKSSPFMIILFLALAILLTILIFMKKKPDDSKTMV
jgi:hypothetical protein